MGMLKNLLFIILCSVSVESAFSGDKDNAVKHVLVGFSQTSPGKEVSKVAKEYAALIDPTLPTIAGISANLILKNELSYKVLDVDLKLSTKDVGGSLSYRWEY